MLLLLVPGGFCFLGEVVLAVGLTAGLLVSLEWLLAEMASCCGESRVDMEM